MSVIQEKKGIVEHPITEEQYKIKQRIESNLYHTKPLKRTILTAFKDESLKQYICSEVYYNEIGLEGTLLMQLLSECQPNYELINLVLPYSDCNYVNSRHYSIISQTLSHHNLNFIKKIFRLVKPEKLIYDELIIDLINNKKLEPIKVGEIIKNILRVNPTKSITDIKCDENSILFHLTTYNAVMLDYFDLFEYLIEELNCDVNENNGIILKELMNRFTESYIGRKNYELQLSYIELFVDNGYNIEEHKFYDFYLKCFGTSQLIINYIKPQNDNKCNTIYTSDKCGICYEKYNTVLSDTETVVQQVALIPCGHTICNDCCNELSSNCPICRVMITNKIFIK